MRIKPSNIQVPAQSAYDFCDGQLHSDPSALSAYLAMQNNNPGRAKPSCYTRSYEKAKRLQRMAERARKDRSRRYED